MNQPIQVRSNGGGNNEAILLLRAILDKQNEQNALLTALVKRQSENTRQTAQWKNEHPELSSRCKEAAQKASNLMNQMIERLVNDLEELEDDEDWGGEPFALNELIDKYGYKFQQFSALLHTLAQLGNQ